ncbi:MAG: hypothetical protein JW745_09685 [Sedimentisphaerales bacterium]|nr:hypothetical protein [Sedimentisphaerales bacterium]MBN2842155.1 hypothetical protein [Sedimentisphaerales bacterium]
MAEKFNDEYRVLPCRWNTWNYSLNGMYFITICTDKRKHYFGDIKNNQNIQLSEIGKIALQYLIEIPQHFPYAHIDEYAIMPDHIHAIIIIDKSPVETHDYASHAKDSDPIAPVETHDYASQNKCKPGSACTSETHNHASLHFANQARHTDFATNKFGPQSKNLSSIIRGYKASVKKFTNINNISFQWQTRFYDRVIRTPLELRLIRQYIIDNPKNWLIDKDNEEDYLILYDNETNP